MPKVMSCGSNVFPIVIPMEGSIVFAVLNKCFIGVIHITPGFLNGIFLFHNVVIYCLMNFRIIPSTLRKYTPEARHDTSMLWLS